MSGESPEAGEQVLGWPANLSGAGGAGQQVSEEEELRLLGFPPSREDLSTAIPLTVIFSLLLVTGCVGNMCTAIVIARPKNKYMHTATNYYLFSLALSDFLFLTLGLPQELYSIWHRYPYAFGETFCIMRSYLSEASTYASILTISAFTVERYVAICHPLWAHTMSQLPRAVTSIVIIWLLAALCAIPPAAELGIVTQRGPISNRTLEASAQCNTKRTIYENMFAVSAIVFFLVPMVIVTVLYILIALELRRSSRMNSAISAAGRLSNSQARASVAPQASADTCSRCCHRGAPTGTHHSTAEQVPPALSTSPSADLAAVAAAASGAGDQVAAGPGNLLARIMSHRPSSAIGNERPRDTCRCQCRCRGALQPSQSHQYPLAPPAAAAAAAADSSRLHSPLCYHESLLQPSSGGGGGEQHPPPASATCGAPARQQPRHHNHYARQHHQFPGHQHPALAHAGSGHRRLTTASSKKSVIRMLVVVSFFICWLPFHAQRLLASYLTKDEGQHNQLLFDVYLKLTYISGIMYYLSSTINPLLYQLMSAKFRLAFKETFNCSLVKCSFFTRRSSGCSPSNSLNAHTNKHSRATHYSPNCRYKFHDCHFRQPSDINKHCCQHQNSQVAPPLQVLGSSIAAPADTTLSVPQDRKFRVPSPTSYFASLKDFLGSLLLGGRSGPTCCSGNRKSVDTTCCHLTLCENGQPKSSAAAAAAAADMLEPVKCASSPLLGPLEPPSTDTCHSTVFKFIAKPAQPLPGGTQVDKSNPLERLITAAAPARKQTTELDLITDETPVLARSLNNSSSSSPQQALLTDSQLLEKKNSLSTTNSVIDECSTSCTTAYSHFNPSASLNQLLQHPAGAEPSATLPLGRSLPKTATGSLLDG